MNAHPTLASPKKPRRRVGIYARARDDEGLRRQREDVERYVAAQPGWAIAALYEDITRSDRERPALGLLMSDAENGAIDVVVVHDMSRLGRSVEECIRILKALDENGVGVVTSAEGLDTGTPQGRLVMAAIVAIAESSRDSRLDCPGGTQ